MLRIATGLSAKSRNWKNIKITWENLAEKLSKTVVTPEAHKDFISSSKEEQGKIKDVGGYVGGYLRNGRRKPENVASRQLLTLDIDFADGYLWDDFTLLYGEAAVLHSTHKHSEEKPRLRLVMPLSREVTPDEYVAIARYVAGTIGIDKFDNTTFETNRLMFWPSTPIDKEYYFREQKGNWLDAGNVLAAYKDWRDSSEWPIAGRDVEKITNLVKKQQDPEEKGGIIGAFCRTYGISEVIEKYLSDFYEATIDENRYTYLKGSTSAGLVVYDNKFAYSHHSTDPCSGKLCNAFDLVRLHTFGHLDTREDAKVKESLKAMQDFAASDSEVKKLIARENIEEAKKDFEGFDEVIELDWVEQLEVNSKGVYVSTANNLNVIFANDSILKSLFKYNEFDYKPYICKSAPWRKLRQPEPMRNVDISGVRNYIECVYGITGTQKIDDTIALEIEKNSFHPIRNYFTGLKWDGVKRVDYILQDYFGVVDNIYTREAMRKTLVGAVARVIEPGVKFDLVLTLVGKQGKGKSTFINKLGGAWYSDSFTTVKGKEAFEQLQGAWLIEMAELSGLKKAEVENVKHFLSKQSDTFRPAYGKIPETFRRQCVFFGTTNSKDFLKDPSGNRRFMPIDIDPDKALLSVFDLAKSDVDQFWAEAVELYGNNETLYLSREAEAIAYTEQNKHKETDEREGLIVEYLEKGTPDNWDSLNIPQRRDWLDGSIEYKGAVHRRDFVCVAEVWCECLGKDRDDMDRYKTRELNDILRSLDGWEQCLSTRSFKGYGTQKYYVRI